MPKRSVRAGAMARRAAASCCLGLALAGSVQAADLAPRRRITVKLGAAEQMAALPAPPAVPDPDPLAGLGLLQRLGLFIDMLATGRTAADLLASAHQPAEFKTDGGGSREVIPYSGPLAVGTVVINLDRRQLYRILEGGWAELYQERTEDAILTRLGIARETGRVF